MAGRSVRVREAGPADGAAIGRIHVEAWRVAYEHVFGAGNLATLDVAERQARWTARLEGEPGWEEAAILVAETEADGVVGWVAAGRSRDDDPGAAEGELHGIYVHPDAWGTGAGRALLDATVELLRGRGYREATLWVLDDNPRARRFYEREGWALDGAAKEDEFFGVRVREVRYRRALR